jgi:thiol:disulfide interchange protein DsbD
MSSREPASIRRLLLLAGAVAVVLVLLPHVAHAAPAAANCQEHSSFDEYRSRGWGWAFLASFGFGFLTSLTPCVYPMIPIVLGVFGARGKTVGRGKAMTLATLYVVGMGATYTALGVVFALVGGQFGSILSDWRFVVPIDLIYLALAASMFGAFELNLPASWQAKLNTVGGAGYGGAFAMGLVGGFTAAPCTGPFLLGILGFVAKSGNAAIGGSLLFTYALGMGVLFWVLAAFAIALPKSGRWMEWVKSVGGIALLAAAIYFLRPVIPAMAKLGSAKLWYLAAAVVVTAAGIALGAIHLSFHDGPAVKVRKGIAVALTVVGLSGVVLWLLTPDRHLPWLRRDAAQVQAMVEKEQLTPAPARPDGSNWLNPAEAAAFAKAAKEGKGVMFDFSANWCVPCQELELAFAEKPTYDAITKNFVPVKIDISKGTDEDFDFKDRYGVELKDGTRDLTLPAIVFLDAQGHIVGRFGSGTDPSAVMTAVRPAIAALHGEAGTPCVATK